MATKLDHVHAVSPTQMGERNLRTGSARRDQKFWEQYLCSRTGTYEFRCIRYAEVLLRLQGMGFSNGHSVLDVGAGRQEFCTYLRQQGWTGDYHPVDGSLDGVDIDDLVYYSHVQDDIPFQYDWVVAIEVIEHLYYAGHAIRQFPRWATKGVVVTTPNPKVVDVYAIDPTHVTAVRRYDLEAGSYVVAERSLFAKEDDSLVAWRKAE